MNPTLHRINGRWALEYPTDSDVSRLVYLTGEKLNPALERSNLLAEEDEHLPVGEGGLGVFLAGRDLKHWGARSTTSSMSLVTSSSRPIGGSYRIRFDEQHHDTAEDEARGVRELRAQRASCGLGRHRENHRLPQVDQVVRAVRVEPLQGVLASVRTLMIFAAELSPFIRRWRALRAVIVGWPRSTRITGR